MNIYALLSWYVEDPEHLERCVRSLEGFADVLIAVDGPYATFPGETLSSSPAEHWALKHAANAIGITLHKSALGRWPSEVEKRAWMFDYGRNAGATSADWFLIVDADMTLGWFTPDARARLAGADRDVAEVRWHDMQIDGKASSTMRFRSMFRALPGLTVERTHFLYTVPISACCGDLNVGECCRKARRRFLWHTPDGHISKEPALDLTDAVTLHHFNSQRAPERKRRALEYYKDRDARGLESAGDWR